MTNPLDTLPAISARQWLRILGSSDKSGVFGLTFDQEGADASFWYHYSDRLVTLKIVSDITPDVLASVIALRDAHEAAAEAVGAGGWSAGAIMTTQNLGDECAMHGYLLEQYLGLAPWYVYAVWADGEYERSRA